mmetsp:Transcript_7746/g.18389  ORF Transcript_7746/g.18389 Transcript_7746/m.18389 type:complete len:118 (-) Transcript_7746:558-911(-)
MTKSSSPDMAKRANSSELFKGVRAFTLSRGLHLVAVARADIFAVVADLSHAETQLADETPRATKPERGPYYITDTRGIHKPFDSRDRRRACRLRAKASATLRTCALCGDLYKGDDGE